MMPITWWKNRTHYFIDATGETYRRLPCDPPHARAIEHWHAPTGDWRTVVDRGIERTLTPIGAVRAMWLGHRAWRRHGGGM